jgi:hypothetical protein
MKRGERIQADPSKSPSRKHLARVAINYFEQLKQWQNYDKKKPSVSTEKSRPGSHNRSLSQYSVIHPDIPLEEVYIDEEHRRKQMDELKVLMKVEIEKNEHDGALDFNQREIAKAYTGYPEFMRREPASHSPNPQVQTHVVRPVISELKEAANEAERLVEETAGNNDDSISYMDSRMHPSPGKSNQAHAHPSSHPNPVDTKLFHLELAHQLEYKESPLKNRFEHHQRMAKEIRRLQYASGIGNGRSRSPIAAGQQKEVKKPTAIYGDQVLRDAIVHKAPPRTPPAIYYADYFRKEVGKPIALLKIDTSKELKVIFNDNEEPDPYEHGNERAGTVTTPFGAAPEPQTFNPKETRELRHKTFINRTPSTHSYPDDIVGDVPQPMHLHITIRQEMSPAREDIDDKGWASKEKEAYNSVEEPGNADNYSSMHSNYQERCDQPLVYRADSLRESLAPPSEPDEPVKAAPVQETILDSPTIRPADTLYKTLEQFRFEPKKPLAKLAELKPSLIAPKFPTPPPKLQPPAQPAINQKKVDPLTLHLQKAEHGYFHKPAPVHTRPQIPPSPELKKTQEFHHFKKPVVIQKKPHIPPSPEMKKIQEIQHYTKPVPVLKQPQIPPSPELKKYTEFQDIKRQVPPPKPTEKSKPLPFKPQNPAKPVPLSPERPAPKPAANVTDSPVLSPSPERYSLDIDYTYVHRVYDSPRLTPSPEKYSQMMEYAYAPNPEQNARVRGFEDEVENGVDGVEQPSEPMINEPKEENDGVDAHSAQHSSNSSIREDDSRGENDDHPTEHESEMTLQVQVEPVYIYPSNEDTRSVGKQETEEPYSSNHNSFAAPKTESVQQQSSGQLRTDPKNKFPVWAVTPKEPIPCLLSSPDGFSIDPESGKLEIKNGDRILLEPAEYGKFPKINDIVRAPTEDMKGHCDFFVKDPEGKKTNVVVMLRSSPQKKPSNCSLYDPEQKKVGRAYFQLVGTDPSSGIAYEFHNGVLLDETCKVSEVLVKRADERIVDLKRGPNNITKQKVKGDNASNLQGTPVNILTLEIPLNQNTPQRHKKTELVIYNKTDYRPIKGKLIDGETGRAECEDGQIFEGPLLIEGKGEPELFLLIPPAQRVDSKTPKYIIVDFDPTSEPSEYQHLKEKVRNLAKGRSIPSKNYSSNAESARGKENRETSKPKDAKKTTTPKKSKSRDKSPSYQSGNQPIDSKPNTFRSKSPISNVPNQDPSLKDFESLTEPENFFYQLESKKKLEPYKEAQPKSEHSQKKHQSNASNSTKNAQTAKTIPTTNVASNSTQQGPSQPNSIRHSSNATPNKKPRGKENVHSPTPGKPANHRSQDKLNPSSSGNTLKASESAGGRNPSNTLTPDKSNPALLKGSVASSQGSLIENQARLQFEFGSKGSLMRFEGVGKIVAADNSITPKSSKKYSEQLREIKARAANTIQIYWRYANSRSALRRKSHLRYDEARRLLSSKSQFKRFLLHHVSLPGHVPVKRALENFLMFANSK